MPGLLVKGAAEAGSGKMGWESAKDGVEKEAPGELKSSVRDKR